MKLRKIVIIVTLSMISTGCGFKGALTYDDNTTHKTKEWPQTNQGPVDQTSISTAEINPPSAGSGA
jgi:predicted small lipoprotein YifL